MKINCLDKVQIKQFRLYLRGSCYPLIYSDENVLKRRVVLKKNNAIKTVSIDKNY